MRPGVPKLLLMIEMNLEFHVVFYLLVAPCEVVSWHFHREALSPISLHRVAKVIRNFDLRTFLVNLNAAPLLYLSFLCPFLLSLEN